MQKLGSFLFTATLVSAFVGCQVTQERSIIGTYRAEAPCVTITLALKQDHMFMQSAQTASGGRNELVGKWYLGPDHDLILKPALGFSHSALGEKRDLSGGPVDRTPRGVAFGPIIVACPDSSHEVDYIKE